MKIGVLGVGKLGLCFALNLESAGHEVLGVDINQDYVRAINNKEFFSYEPEVNGLLESSKKFHATTNILEVLDNGYEILFLMVATPSLPDGSYDHSQIERVGRALIDFGMRERRVNLVIGCTVMPGFGDQFHEQLSPLNYSVSYNPEFIAQGSIIHDQLHADHVLIGEANPEIGDTLERLYKGMCKSDPVICRMSRLSAEICKLATNCFLTTKISFANSVGDLATKAGAEPEKILAAIGSDSRIGEKYLKYGFGFGGPCFPRDNRALNLFARQNKFNLIIGEATDRVNQQHLQFQFDQYMENYDSGEVIVFDSIAYKKETVILDESQPLALALKLAHAGRTVKVRDKEAVIEEVKKTHGDILLYEITRP